LTDCLSQDFIPTIARECREEMISNQEEELAQRDRYALESQNNFLL
jgi:hypothetical protein